MSITKCPGHMRSLKLNFSATVLTLGLKAKIFENLRLCQAKFWGELRTRATFDRCVRGSHLMRKTAGMRRLRAYGSIFPPIFEYPKSPKCKAEITQWCSSREILSE